MSTASLSGSPPGIVIDEVANALLVAERRSVRPQLDTDLELAQRPAPSGRPVVSGFSVIRMTAVAPAASWRWRSPTAWPARDSRSFARERLRHLSDRLN